jgi:hypothetical protein
VGGTLTVSGQLTANDASFGMVVNGAGISLQTAGSASIRYQDAGVSKWWIYKLSGDPPLYFRDMLNARMQMVMTPGATSSAALTTLSSRVFIEDTTASTTTSSGALVVGNGTSGGLGVGGAINAGGIIATTAAAQRVINTSGAFQIYKDATPTGAARFSYNLAAANTISLGVYDGSSWTDSLLVSTTDVTIASGVGLRVGNAYTAGAPTATGYIVIKDSNGTSYKIPAQAL